MAYSPILNPHPVSFTQQALPANQSVNAAQINGVTPLMGNGVTGAGSIRVTIASDNTAFSVNAVQSGTWNIGTVTTLPALVAGTALIGKVGIDQTTVGTTNAVALAQIGANTILTGNGVTGTGSQRVTIASDNTAFSVNATLQTGANVIGSLTANQSVNHAQVAGVATATGNGVVGTGVQRVAVASDNTAFSVNTIQPTLTKGTQGSTGVSVQNLRDAGRNTIALTAEFAFAQTAETILTVTQSQNGGTTNTFTSKAIPSGKKFRITAMYMIVELLGSGTAPQRAYLRLRFNTGGAATASSPLQAILAVGVTTAIVKATSNGMLEFPEGLEFDANGGSANFCLTLETPDWVTTTATGRVKITVVGYEY